MNVPLIKILGAPLLLGGSILAAQAGIEAVDWAYSSALDLKYGGLDEFLEDIDPRDMALDNYRDLGVLAASSYLTVIGAKRFL